MALILPISFAVAARPLVSFTAPMSLTGIALPAPHTIPIANLLFPPQATHSLLTVHTQSQFARTAFLALLVLVAVLRLVELRISRRNRRLLAAQGAKRARDPIFAWMAALHAAVLIGAACEVIFFRRPFLPLLAVIAGIFFLAANALRWWVIATLGSHWNVQVMDASAIGVVADGPYRWIRHPNYVAVFVEMLALPLIHTAWLTAGLGGAAHLLVLGGRMRAEDAVLFSNPAYRALMGGKPRFLPRLATIAAPNKRSAMPGNLPR